jgi:hypothetical protein
MQNVGLALPSTLLRCGLWDKPHCLSQTKSLTQLPRPRLPINNQPTKQAYQRIMTKNSAMRQIGNAPAHRWSGNQFQQRIDETSFNPVMEQPQRRRVIVQRGHIYRVPTNVVSGFPLDPVEKMRCSRTRQRESRPVQRTRTMLSKNSLSRSL